MMSRFPPASIIGIIPLKFLSVLLSESIRLATGRCYRETAYSLRNPSAFSPLRPALPCMKIPRPFAVSLTGDFFDSAGRPKFPDLGLTALEEAAHVSIMPFSSHEPEIRPEQLAGINGAIVLTPAVTRRSVEQPADLLVIGRFGVGYDTVDVKACTEADVAVLIATGAVDRSVAEAVVCWMLALTHHATAKHRIVQTGGWDARSRYMGSELRGRTLGVIGLGGIARSLIKLLEGWGMNQPLAFDPYVDAATASAAGARLVTLDELLSLADFVSVHCPLTPATRNLIGVEQLARMRPNAYLLNTARGGIVDENALCLALREGQLAGAGIDCFADEPVRGPHPLGEFENVLLAPHSIAWTRELFRDIGRTVSAGLLAFSHRQKPKGVVNPEVFQRPGFIEKWQRVTEGLEA